MSARIFAICYAGFLCLAIPFALPAQVKITHGPVVGAVTERSARLLVRTQEEADIQFELAPDTSFAVPIVTAPVRALAGRDYFAIAGVTGLEPNTTYFYRPVIDGHAQPLAGSFQTFPPAGTATEFTFAFGACQQAFGDPFSNIGRVWPLIVAERPRFFLQLGDWTYPDTTDSRTNPGDYFSVDYARVQSSYHAKYTPDYPMSELFKIVPIDYVYDDHDYTHDNSDRTYAGRENSIRGYREMFPHYELPNGANGIWHKFTFGNADFFMLDTRAQRAPNRDAFVQDSSTGKFTFRPHAAHLILQADPQASGELQMDWLIRELVASTATWKFICTSVPFNPTHSRASLEIALLLQGVEGLDPVPFGPEPLSAAEVAFAISDMWGGFPQSVARLVQAVHNSGVKNVIMLSGDSHTAAIDDGANALFPECMAGGLDRSNSREVVIAELFRVFAWNRGGQTLARNNFNSHYGKITVFGDDSVRMALIDEYGELITSYILKEGRLVDAVALVVAPFGVDFGKVRVGSSGEAPLLLINIGAETVSVHSLAAGDAQFAAEQETLLLQPGEVRAVKLSFRPLQVGRGLATLTIESNDPQSPFQVPLAGEGIPDTTTALASREPGPPQRFQLLQNYPNPFNAGTRISYHLAQPSDVTVVIYNMAGREVRRFRFRAQGPGRYHLGWDGRDRAGRVVAAGVYVYRLEVREMQSRRWFSQSRKMMYLP